MSRVYLHHARKLGYCSCGMREFCKKYGLDYVSFIKDGIESQELLDKTNHDAMSVAVVEVAHG